MTSKASVEKKRYPYWFYIVMVLIPVIFFVLLEGGLRLFGYGTEWHVFTEFSAYPGMMYPNPDLAAKYFPELANIPRPIFDGFEKEKGNSTYRIFVLGESSAAGWPYIPNVSFPRCLKRKLELLYPEKNVEVINLGVSAICTYTIRDILPDVLKQQPDAILIYTGHNEFYGALGAGSTQSFGNSRFITNSLLYLQNLRSVQLVQNILKSIMGTGAKKGSENGQNETLMAKVIGQSSIPYGSDTYNAGLKQFEGNMRDILSMCHDANVPVVLGNLACNLRDRKPFISESTQGQPAADALFRDAQDQIKTGDKKRALDLFRQARDMDGLRFRAPGAVNTIIRELSREYNTIFVDVDSLINVSADSGIAGNDLMVDHLHPNVRGYKLISEGYFKALSSSGLLPAVSQSVDQGKVAVELETEFPYTSLDSTWADLRIRVLTGAYPFVPKGTPNLLVVNHKAVNFIDSLAMQLADGYVTLEEAHYKMADYYMARGDDVGFENELRVLIADRPNKAVHYEKLINGLVERQQLKRALKYLLKLDKFRSDEFTTKFIGTISVGTGDYETGKVYLQRYVNMKQDDPQAWYNLSGAYAQTGEVLKALEAVKRALRLAPNYLEARAFYQQLSKAAGQY